MYNLDSFVLVYNPLQNEFHTETLRAMLEANEEIFRKGLNSPWYVLRFAASALEVDTLREEYETTNPRNTTA